MRRRQGCIGILAALAISLFGTADVRAAPGSDADQATSAVTVSGTSIGQAMAPGFLGVSLEYQAVHLYTGRNPGAINPVLVQLIHNLAPGETPVLRIGGDSTDSTWWPIKGVIPPPPVTYRLTKGWLRTTRALAQATGARLIMGINLASGRPALAAAEARAIVAGIGRQYLEALEIGNEPDLYGVQSWYRDQHGRAVFARRPSYGLSSFIKDFSHWRAALPPIPLAGPTLAELTWLTGLDQFLSAEPGLGLATVHRYPLRGCIQDHASPSYASIPNLLSDQSSVALAQGVAPYVAIAHAHGLPFRVDEMNSVACSGRRGVSNTFASALWVLDALFNMAKVGVDGVNVHSLPGASYELFTFTHAFGVWAAFVHPEYYGMLMFEQAFPPGARLLALNAPAGPVKIWATTAPDGKTRVVLINQDTTAAHTVQVQLPGVDDVASLEMLSAPSVESTTGVTLGGQTFGAETSTGTPSGLQSIPSVVPVGGVYTVTLPPASAGLLTEPLS